MAKIYIYNPDKTIKETLDSADFTLDGFLEKLINSTPKSKQLEVNIEECFDSVNTYFNFIPNIVRGGDISDIPKGNNND